MNEREEESAEKQKRPWLRFRWMKRTTSLNQREVYCWDKQLALTSTLHDQHENTHTHTHRHTPFQSVHREVTFKVDLPPFFCWLAATSLSSGFFFLIKHWVKRFNSSQEQKWQTRYMDSKYSWYYFVIFCNSADLLMMYKQQLRYSGGSTWILRARLRHSR